MTPVRLVELVARALGRPATRYELDTWAPVLARINDDDADQALIAHRAASPHPPTPADVLKHAIAIANDRAMRDAAARRRLEVETGIAQEGEHAGKPLVPMPPQVRAGLRDLVHRRQIPAVDAADDARRLAEARAELAARAPVPAPDEQPVGPS